MNQRARLDEGQSILVSSMEGSLRSALRNSGSRDFMEQLISVVDKQKRKQLMISLEVKKKEEEGAGWKH
eukprot:CAMPEP_0202963932 /NCGR_PEP_ID=MMETSP1396-20130829/7996_1 /ASSEMBLY_ACC=CAM_ASM_000872 /TAXON_ID= /ORGANISM="Pseudokeronopsis sp., Strain Brazil" /LENGTH=68 /DNA_ID=CAMNT_0049685613 /DNA_START=673 /DNA_END=879 /DNA_ORIENTATION=-